MWREWMLAHHPVGETLGGQVAGPEFSLGATPDELAEVERSLDARLPVSLRELLAETNGIFADYGSHFIYSTSEMIERN